MAGCPKCAQVLLDANRDVEALRSERDQAIERADALQRKLDTIQGVIVGPTTLVAGPITVGQIRAQEIRTMPRVGIADAGMGQPS